MLAAEAVIRLAQQHSNMTESEFLRIRWPNTFTVVYDDGTSALLSPGGSGLGFTLLRMMLLAAVAIDAMAVGYAAPRRDSLRTSRGRALAERTLGSHPTAECGRTW